MKYYSLNNYLKDTFGKKVYKIAINGGFTCPNRDGKPDRRGCIFCSGVGSGDFAGKPKQTISEQIEAGKVLVQAKIKEEHPVYIAYFQAFTNTYATVEELRKKYFEAINHPDIVGISIATRPDCLDEDVLALLYEVNKIKPLWVELGLQTVHSATASYIRRGYDLAVYEEAVEKLQKIGVHIVTHIILGLPDESKEMMLESVRYVGDLAKRFDTTTDESKDCSKPEVNSCTNSGINKVAVKSEDNFGKKHQFGIKLQLLHIIRGTDLAKDYEAGKFQALTLEDYVDLIVDCLKVLPEDMVIHRITGDGDKRTLIAPLWSGDKKRVLNTLNKAINEAI